MNLIDTHSHLYAEEFDADRDACIERATAAGVGRLLLPAIDSESHERLFDLARRHPALCRPMMGLHPTSIDGKLDWRAELRRVEELLDTPPAGLAFCAVGEIGLDYYWDTTYAAEQREAFVAQLRMAAARDLPVAIHTRSAWEDMAAVMEAECAAAAVRGERLRGVFHAYSEGIGMYRRLRACGDFRFGIGGVVTFRKSTLAGVVAQMELADLVLETDCPYLTPAPHRGTRNESAYVPFIAQKIAELHGVTAAEVARVTTSTAEELFAL